MAVDVQGARRARPWVEKAGAEFIALVDRDNLLGARFGFRFVPLSMLFDESGRPVRGPTHVAVDDGDALAEIDAWLRDGTVPKARRDRRPDMSEHAGSAEAELRFALAGALLQNGRSADAVVQLREALQLDPKNWLVRKQIWAIEHPDRFYDGPVDFRWQKEQVQRDRQSR